MNRLDVPFADLVDAFPELFGIDGTKRRELEQLADNLGVDRDFTRGIDDGEGTWNQPNNE